MFRSVTRAGGYEVSGDIPGAVSRMLEANPAGAPVTLTFAGAEGDQKSLFQSVQPAVGKMPAQDAGVGGWAVQDVQAQRVTTAVFELIAAMQPGISAVTVKAAAGSATCPGQPRVRTDGQTGTTTSEE